MTTRNNTKIKFGTSGWRAIMAEDFTFDNVRLVSLAIAGYLRSQKPAPKVIVGYDTRFLSSGFAEVCAEVLSQNGVKVLLCCRDVPTPVLAYQIIDKKFDGAVNFTASHNPPEYNGIKFSPAYGGPAPKEITSDIEKRIAALQKGKDPLKRKKVKPAKVEMFDPRPGYLRRIKEIIDFNCIRKAKLKIGVDCMYGTSRQYLDELLKGRALRLQVFCDYLNPLFGGNPPEPDKDYIKELTAYVRANKFNLGLACDGDADRFGIVDEKGVFLTPNEVFTLAFYYLISRRKKAKKVARTLATTHMIDAIAAKEGIELVETPVGFKYIGEALDEGDCLIGGEESGGLSIKGHVPEKDGILACLLMTEMVAREKRSLREILGSLYKKYGYFYSDRINLHIKESKKEALLKKLEALKKKTSFGGSRITRTDFRDGYKFVFKDNYWMMFRPSGTEPVIRCYFEAGSHKQLARLKKQIVDFIG